MQQHPFGLGHPPQARRPVAWYALGGLWQLVREQLWSTKLLRNLDRRETFHEPFECSNLRSLASAAEPDLWIDFVADTGDGGNATTTVAQAVLARALAAEGAATPLPEARLLVLGGDLAYPAASPESYQSRLVEMFELARDPLSRYTDVPRTLPHGSPWLPQHRLLAAIPQNHDWFDSASTFCRYFVNAEKAGLVGARAPQRRTYFAMALPHGWAMLGLDFALTGDIDRSQFEALAGLLDSGDLAPGTNVILVLPEPVWTKPLAEQTRAAYPLRWQRLEHLLATRGCPVRLRLAGDLHCYARETMAAAPPAGRSADLVVCGSGGAFGHGTHGREFSQPKVMQWASDPAAAQAELRGRLLLGRVPPHRAAAQGLPFEPAGARLYPPPEVSFRAALGNAGALLRPGAGRLADSNLAFALGMGALLATAALAPTTWAGAAWGVLALTALVVAADNDPARAGLPEWAAAAVQAGLLGALVLAWRAYGPPVPLPWLPLAVLGASVVAGLAFGLYLLVLGALLGRAINNSASALDGQDHKGFLRMRLGPDGLECWMLGCDHVPRQWVPAGDATTLPYWRAVGEPARWRVVDHWLIRH